MSNSTWPQPPVHFEHLPAVVELLGVNASHVLCGWVLVPATWISAHEPAGPQPRRPPVHPDADQCVLQALDPKYATWKRPGQ